MKKWEKIGVAVRANISKVVAVLIVVGLISLAIIKNNEILCNFVLTDQDGKVIETITMKTEKVHNPFDCIDKGPAYVYLTFYADLGHESQKDVISSFLIQDNKIIEIIRSNGFENPDGVIVQYGHDKKGKITVSCLYDYSDEQQVDFVKRLYENGGITVGY